MTSEPVSKSGNLTAEFHRGVPSVPQELIDIIIDFLHDDTQALRRCSTICRSWLSSSRYHLFYAIDIDCSMMRRSGKYQRLLASFQDSPHLALCVRQLTVSDTSAYTGDDLDERIISAICSKVRRVRKLTLHRICFQSITTHLKASICSLFSQPLVCLSLVDVNIQSFSELTTLLVGCRRLNRLELFMVQWEDKRGITGDTCGSSPLTGHGFGPQELLVDGLDYQQIESILGFVGPSIETFQLNDIFGHLGIEGYNCDNSIDLSKMTNLKNLALNIGQSSLLNPAPWINRSLSSTKASNCVETISIHTMEHHIQFKPVRLDWEWYKTIDETITASAFPKLYKVSVTVSPFQRLGLPETRDLRDHFPLLDKRGILSPLIRKQGKTVNLHSFCFRDK